MSQTSHPQTSEALRDRLNTLMQLRQEVESLAGAPAWVPCADWLETDGELLLVMDLPGVDRDHLELAWGEGSLTVRGVRAPLELGGSVLSAERPQGHFQRTLRLPGEVAPGGDAQLRAGVLMVRFEKQHKVIDHG